jgi:hypothetical protein
MNVNEEDWDAVDLIYLAQGFDRWWSFAKMLMNVWVS